MSLFRVPILTDGASHPAAQFRMLIKDLARGAEGITEGDDLKVTQRSTPGAGVTVADGSCVIKGRDDAFQGHYSAYNAGAYDVDIAATGGAGRSDMLIVRVKDPEYIAGLDPETDQIVFFEVISNVSSSATAIPDGRTGIPLARIDIPSSTATITNAMITDLRKVANPRRDFYQFIQSPSSLSTDISGTSGTYSNFSTASGWSVAIPDWATTAILTLAVGQIRYNTAAFFGGLRATFGASLTVQPVVLDDNQSGVRRGTIVLGDTLTIPSAYRGTSQTLRFQACGSTGNVGKVGVDSSTTFLASVQFLEAPR
ncbi:hypothetical protein [Streptomyces pseudovenezuelae]|uniref:hypothetical protein n=1 Tax=Streptomyces pseudovenezuelae TaxID=67350 RepID=UPI002E806673|nr:hypothetical protein [Streptomyces pseudovenezuelae]WUA94438.1 hypothetical protein OHO81_45175 [Streptomyces pseudovenezuelae]